MNQHSPAVPSNLSSLSLRWGCTSAANSEPGTRNPKLPIGLQLLGKPLDEETILKIAHAYEEARLRDRKRLDEQAARCV